MTELARLISFVEARVAVNVLFVRPAGVTDEWMRTDTWDSAQEIPGAIVREDPEGADAKRFGAETSGQVVVYDPAGRLLFRGGITGSRGHEGDNLGLSRAIRSIRAGDESGESSVFGCALAENKMGEDR